MTVEELFTSEKITKENVEEIGENSEYWAKASDFVLKYWEIEIDLLSVKQAAWLSGIHEDMVEKRIEGRL